MASYIYIGTWISFAVALVSLCCSVVTLFVIRSMRARSGYFAIIASMTICEMIYETNFVLGVFPGYGLCVVKNMLDVFGGLSFSLWSNVLSLVVLHIVVHIRSIDIGSLYKYFFFAAVAPPLLLAVVVPFALERSDGDDHRPNDCDFRGGSLIATIVANAYYWGRIFTICVNFVTFFVTNQKVARMTQSVGGKREAWALAALDPRQLAQRLFGQDGGTRDTVSQARASAVKQCVAIVVLASRMKFYPLAQAVSRSGGAWNEFNNYEYSDATSNFLASILNPSQGIFDFIIIMIMQPRAWSTLKRALTGSAPVQTHGDLGEPVQEGVAVLEITRSPMSSVDDPSGARLSFGSTHSDMGFSGPLNAAFDDLEESDLESVLNVSSCFEGAGQTLSLGSRASGSAASTYLSAMHAHKSAAAAVNRHTASGGADLPPHTDEDAVA